MISKSQTNLNLIYSKAFLIYSYHMFYMYLDKTRLIIKLVNNNYLFLATSFLCVSIKFSLIIFNNRPHLLDFNKLVEDREKFTSSYKYKEYTLENAFNIAQKKLQIERLLDIEGIKIINHN